MSPQIVRIEDAGPERKARRLIFDDGTEPRLTSKAAVKALALEVGAKVDTSALETALADLELPLAKERALMLLGYRERSRAELGRKLRGAGYSDLIADQVVTRFTEVALVDDERFASAWVRTRAAAGYGAQRIARELAQRGIAPEVAAEALEPISDAAEQLNRACAALRGRAAADRKDRDRLVRRLVGKGFGLQVAIQAVDSAGRTDDSE